MTATGKRKYTKDMNQGDCIDELFMVSQLKLHQYRNRPGQYMAMLLIDKTGQIDAKVWDWSDRAVVPEEGCIMACKGETVEYAGHLEVHIEKLTLVDESKIDITDLIPASPFPIKQMIESFSKTVLKLKNQHLQALMVRFMQDERLFDAYCHAPAAKVIHQAYTGGLMEHCLQTARIAGMIADLYPQADRDVAVAGALLHDVGKIAEYRYGRTIDVTDEGRLLGHIVIGLEILDYLASGVRDFPGKMLLALKHIIISHHGRYEWQSPKRPKTIEACLVHYADAVEADMWKFSVLKEKYGNHGWSPYERSLERYVYLEDLSL
jgi:3'-5' exoribonuclease